MPANLTADYLAAEREFKEAQTPVERIAALELMLATLPKHKGTEKLQAGLRRRLSEARKESLKKGGPHGPPPWLVHREGAGQIALVGPANAGKSSLLAAVSRARPEVGEYPFTTHMPTAGMMPFEDVQIQVVDLPAVAAEYTESWMPQVVRAADATALVLDPGDPDVLGEAVYLLETLAAWKASRPSIVVANKMDLPGAAGNFEALREILGLDCEYVGVSALTGDGLAAFGPPCFRSLGVVRFYSKRPGHKADMDVPYVLRQGQTVREAAARVHRELAEHLKFARLFHDAEDHGMPVEQTHAVEDGDILEFHA